jgi:TetR/AcrR family fatty acid metabolism transcriptional regulator
MPKLTSNARRALIEQRKGQILAAAAKVFARKGYERATIADIAKEAKIAEGSIYNYFKNKADLLVSIPQQVMRPTIEAVSGQLLRGGGTPPPPEAALTTVARNMVAAMRKNAYIFRILLSALPTMRHSTREKYLKTVVVYATGMLEGYLREQTKQGTFRRDMHPAIAARVFIGMFFPFVLLQEIVQVEDQSDYEYEQVIGNAVRIFLNGALADSREREAQ